MSLDLLGFFSLTCDARAGDGGASKVSCDPSGGGRKIDPPGLHSCAVVLRSLPGDAGGVTNPRKAPAAHSSRLAPDTKGVANGFHHSVRDPKQIELEQAEAEQVGAAVRPE